MLPLIVVASPSTATAAKFPPAIEQRKYDRQVEQAIKRLDRASLHTSQAVELTYDLTTRLHVTSESRIVRTFTLPRTGVCYAQRDRLDIRRLAAPRTIESQLIRRGDTFLEYFVYEGELRRLWPDSLEKDQRADEMVFTYVWLPVLVNLYPNEYLRWADDYEYLDGANIGGRSYNALRALPDYRLARKHRDIQSSAAYWGLRPEIRYYINPHTQRIEIIERLFYRWDRAKPDAPSYLYRRCISRVVGWEKRGRFRIPSRILAQELNPREQAPYKEFELALAQIKVGGALPNSAFEGVWPRDQHFEEAELRVPDYYRALVSLNDEKLRRDLSGPLLAAQCAFAVGDYPYARHLVERIRSCVAQSLNVGDLAGFCRVCRASADEALINAGGQLLQAALAELRAPRAGLSEQVLHARNRDVVRLHFAVSEHLSRRIPAEAGGSAWDDRTAAAAYLESILHDVREPACRGQVVARMAIEYARDGLFEKAQSILAEHHASCVDGPETQNFFEGARQRVRYWRERSEWWMSVIGKMQQREIQRNARQQGHDP